MTYQKKSPSNKVFDIVLVGYGGQGVLTLAEILAKAAIMSGYDVKQAELHGLAQRGGSLECHLRFGKEVYSPLVMEAQADLIIGLDLLETLRACYYANKNKTTVLTNSKIFSPCPFKEMESKKTETDIKKFAKKVKLVDAEKLMKALTKDTAMINTLLLGFTVSQKFIPIKKQIILKAMAERIRPQFIELNKKIFDLAFK